MNIIPPDINLFGLKNERLQFLFNQEFDEFERSLLNMRKLTSDKDFRNEIYICFWLAIHMENFEFSQYLINLNDSFDLRKDCT